jgi:hypothetical protein
MMTGDPRVEAAAKALTAEGAAPGSSIHSWRCEYPDRYGECGCVHETAGIVLAAADEVDPVRKAARELAHFIEEDMAVSDDCYDDPTKTPVATVSWQDITRLGDLRGALVAALAAAGAQPPPKEDDHG